MDLPLLRREHEANPADARIVFYLAQTLDLVGEDQAALDMYQRRVDMRGWGGEVFEAHMRRVGAPGALACCARSFRTPQQLT